MIIDGFEFPDDPEEGETVRHIQFVSRFEVWLGHETGENELLYVENDVGVIGEPGDALWSGLQRAFCEVN